MLGNGSGVYWDCRGIRSGILLEKREGEGQEREHAMNGSP
jgi:hypothetical protein